jgi:DNA-binding NarL/FixJ family response regulator
MVWLEPRIVILDEDVIFSDQLKNEFHMVSMKNVVRFQSIVDCLTKMNKEPDIIFVEYKMNHCEGIRACRMLKRKWKRTRIILMSVSHGINKKINKKKFGICKTFLKTEQFEEFIAEAQKIKRLRLVKSVLYTIIGTILSIAFVYELT